MPVIISSAPVTFSTETSLGIHSLVNPDNFVSATATGQLGIDLSLPANQFEPFNPWTPPDGLGYTRRRDIDAIFGNFRAFYSLYSTAANGNDQLRMYGEPTTLLAADYNQLVNDWIFNGGGTSFTVNGQTYRTLAASLPQYPDDAGILDAGWYESTAGANNSNWVKNGLPPSVYSEVITAEFYRDVESNYITATKNTNHPCYIDLLSGYELDDRTIPNEPTIIAPITGIVTIGYYRENTLESLPDLRSIYWVSLNVKMVQNVSIKLPIKNCVLGTLYVSDPEVESLITGVPTLVGEYEYLFLFYSYLPDLFAQWQPLYDATNDNPTDALVFPQSIKLHKLAANNDVWNNQSLVSSLDINFDSSHPMYIVASQRSYNWYIAPQNNNNGIGTLVMDSPRTIEIHTALAANNYLVETPAIIGTGTAQNPETPAIHKLDWYIKNGGVSDKLVEIWKALQADKYSINDIDPEQSRVTNIGYLVENIARVLGIRLDSNGEIDRIKEAKDFTRSIVNNPTYDKRAYSPNCFGVYGRLTPHLTNSNGKEAWDKFADIPQMLEALAEHQNRSLGIQQGTEVKLVNATTGNTDYYPNQLAILIDMLAKLQEIQLNSKESFNILYVVSNEIRELWAGIGIPILYRQLFTRYGVFRSLGFQRDKGSLNTSLTTLKINLGIVLGNFIQRPTDRRNPLERLFIKPDKKV